MKTICVINHYCNRLVFFAVPNDYNHKGKSIEEIYNDSYMASFVKEKTARFAIAKNLKKNQ